MGSGAAALQHKECRGALTDDLTCTVHYSTRTVHYSTRTVHYTISFLQAQSAVANEHGRACMKA